MPLIKTNLSQELEKFWDGESPNFTSTPESSLDAATKWSDAINFYASNVIPVSTTNIVATQAFKTTFLTITDNPPNGIAVFPVCFVNYAAALALGMTGAGFVGTPPVIPLDLSAVYSAGFGGASSAVCLGILVDIVDIWFRTGTAVPIAGGAVINWS